MPNLNSDSSSPDRLRPGTSLIAAANAFRADLEAKRRPRNTISSYHFDLTVLAHQIPTKSINQITPEDIHPLSGGSQQCHYPQTPPDISSPLLPVPGRRGDGHSRSTPLRTFFPNRLDLRIPEPLTLREQKAMLAAAGSDEAWSLTAIMLMMHAGLTRSELLNLERGQVDRTDPTAVVIRIVTDDLRKQNQNRDVHAPEDLAIAYDAFLAALNPQGRLFPVGFQAINGMVDRVRRRAGIARSVTPRMLRETFAVRRALAGASAEQLMAEKELGLANDLPQSPKRGALSRVFAVQDRDSTASN